MYSENYLMAVIVIPESENDPEWPNKKSALMLANGLISLSTLKLMNFIY